MLRELAANWSLLTIPNGGPSSSISPEVEAGAEAEAEAEVEAGSAGPPPPPEERGGLEGLEPKLSLPEADTPVPVLNADSSVIARDEVEAAAVLVPG